MPRASINFAVSALVPKETRMAMSTTGYKPPARVLHWVVGIMLLAMFPIGVSMVQDGISRTTQNTLYLLHKNGGVLILLLMILRLGYRLLNPPPHLPATLPPWQVGAAKATHGLLYVMVFFMALTGFVRVQAGGYPIEMLNVLGVPPLIPKNAAVESVAKTAHFWGRFVLFALILAHIGAAVQHATAKKDGVFGRIWPIFPR